MEDVSAKMAALSTSEFGFWFALAVLATLATLYFAYRSLHRARLIENTPTSKIRSAVQGYVELVGTAQVLDGPPIVAPLTGTPCAWYSYRIEQEEVYYSKGQRQTRWSTLESGTSDDLFLIRDETGDCIIDPEGAEVTPSAYDTWRGATRWPSQGPHTRRGLFDGGDYRYSERRLHIGSPLYAIGHFRTEGTDHHGDLKADVLALLRLWKRHPEVHLASYDKNGDGEIDVHEWEEVRMAAEREALKSRAERAVSAVANLLAKDHAARRPFILSATPQDQLTRQYRLGAAMLLLSSLVFGGVAVWLLQARFST